MPISDFDCNILISTKGAGIPALISYFSLSSSSRSHVSLLSVENETRGAVSDRPYAPMLVTLNDLALFFSSMVKAPPPIIHLRLSDGSILLEFFAANNIYSMDGTIAVVLTFSLFISSSIFSGLYLPGSTYLRPLRRKS